MEFETNTPVSDDARALAQAKKVTIEPLHADVMADDTPDSVIVANHLRDGALANISNDIEQDTPQITVTASAIPTPQPHNSPKLYILTAAGFVALALVVVFVVLGS